MFIDASGRCVCYNEGTLKQSNDTFHTHTKSQINASKFLSEKLYPAAKLTLKNFTKILEDQKFGFFLGSVLCDFKRQ